MALVLLAGGAQPVSAQQVPLASKGVRLEVHRGPGAETCPDDASLRAGVTAALGYDPFSEPVDRVFVAVIDGAGGRYSATVSLQDPAGRPLGLQQLKYHLASCDELAAAIELAIALAIDPLATAPPPVVAGGAVVAMGAAKPSAPSIHSDPSVDAGPSTEPPAVAVALSEQATASATVAASAPAPEPNAAHGDWRLTAGVGVAFQAAPTTVPSLSVGAEIRFPKYSFGLEARGDLPSNGTATGGAYRTSLIAGTLVPCYRWKWIGACGLIGVGAQLSEGSGLDPSLTATTPYFAFGARLAADLALTRWLWLRPQVDLWVPIVRTTVIVAEEEAWRTPPISPVASLMVVLAIP